MDRDEIRAKVRDILAEVIEDDNVEIEDATVAEEVPDWDSINHVRMIVDIEAQFGIRFEIEEITRSENVGDLVDMIKAKLDRQGA
ncbi:MAG: acyl carrier protein [Caulobacteraceae bacterium]|nr:acyl carrier protein [Caulobacteraceae bacterium]